MQYILQNLVILSVVIPLEDGYYGVIWGYGLIIT